MQTDRFDELTKLLAQPIPRRRALKIAMASIVGAAFSGLGANSALAACPSGQTLCSGTCRNLKTDRSNCGACGKVCPAGAQCVNGQCVCPTGQRVCDGRCTSTNDPKNCGKCGVVCAQGATCTSGTCQCPSGQVVCRRENDGDDDDSPSGFCAKRCCAYEEGECERMASSGTFSMTVPQTAIRLTGTASRHTSGTMVSVARVTIPHLARNMHAFKIVSSGHFPVLKLASKGTLHHYIPATGKLKAVATVTHAGIYAVRS